MSLPTPIIIGNSTLYCGNCLDILPHLRGIDAVVTDPPYNIGIERIPIHGHRQTYTQSRTIGRKWEFSTAWIDLAAKFDPQHWIVFAGYRDIGPVSLSLERFGVLQTVFAWKKSNAPSMSRPIPRMDVEFILWVRHHKATCGKMGEFKSMVIEVPMAYAGIGGGERIRKWHNGPAAHPCQKPINVLTPFCERLPFETACDPYMGTGTTGVACMTTNRKFIGIEINPEYFEIACRRIEAVQRQSTLILSDGRRQKYHRH